MAKKKTSVTDSTVPEDSISTVTTADSNTDDEASHIIGDMPSVSEHAINASQDKLESQPSDETHQSDGDRDSSGEVWNTDVHSPTKQKTKAGVWRRKRGAGSNKSTVVLPDQRAKIQEQARETAKNNARMAGSAAANSIFLLGTMFGGEEWRPITVDSNGVTFEPIDEKRMMSEAFSEYMLAKGVTDFPPGLTLTMALMSYVAPRLVMPKTKERMKGIKGWIALRIAKRKIKKAFKKQGIDADVTIDGGRLLINGKEYDGSRAYFGNNSERKDIQGKAVGESIQATEQSRGDRT